MLETKEQDPKYENLPKWKQTQDNYIFHPNLLDIMFGHFVVVSHQYD